MARVLCSERLHRGLPLFVCCSPHSAAGQVARVRSIPCKLGLDLLAEGLRCVYVCTQCAGLEKQYEAHVCALLALVSKHALPDSPETVS